MSLESHNIVRDDSTISVPINLAIQTVRFNTQPLSNAYNYVSTLRSDPNISVSGIIFYNQ